VLRDISDEAIQASLDTLVDVKERLKGLGQASDTIAAK
jgi:hypothetical protein